MVMVITPVSVASSIEGYSLIIGYLSGVGQFPPRTISLDNSRTIPPPVLRRTFTHRDNSPDILCIHTYTCMHTHTYTYIGYIHTRIHIHTYMHTYIYMHTYTCIHKHTYIYRYAYIYICMYVCKHTMYLCMYIYIYVYVCQNVNIYDCI